MGHALEIEVTFDGVLVFRVVNLLFVVEASIVVTEVCLVEGLGLVVSKSVGSTDLVGVLVSLSAPSGAVPVLTVHRVARAELFQG